MAVVHTVGRRFLPAAPSLLPGGVRRVFLLLLLPVLVAGCATFSDSMSPIERDLAAQRYDDALAVLEKQSHSERDHVLYLLNKGMIQQIRGDYAASNDAFEAAKKLMRELYATSVSEQTLTFVINDATRSYVGEEYEQVLLNVYKAINYLELGTPDEARVEALQAELKMREFAENLKSSSYSDDAFGRYMAGMIYEQLGEWSDALISYRKAYEAYKRQKVYARVPVPPFLQQDLLRLTEREGLTDENQQYRREFGIERWTSAGDLAKSGEVVFILSNGLAPILREHSRAMVDAATRIGVRISLPYYQSRPAPIGRAVVSADGASASSAVFEDIDAIARGNLDAKMPTIIARAIARQVVKVQAARATQRAVQNSNRNRENGALLGALAGLAMTAVNIATERADTRSWTTLPREIQVARIALPPGRHNVEVKLYDASGGVIATRTYPDVDVQAGGKSYLSLHWMPSQLPQPRRTP